MQCVSVRRLTVITILFACFLSIYGQFDWGGSFQLPGLTIVGTVPAGKESANKHLKETPAEVEEKDKSPRESNGTPHGWRSFINDRRGQRSRNRNIVDILTNRGRYLPRWRNTANIRTRRRKNRPQNIPKALIQDGRSRASKLIEDGILSNGLIPDQSRQHIQQIFLGGRKREDEEKNPETGSDEPEEGSETDEPEEGLESVPTNTDDESESEEEEESPISFSEDDDPNDEQSVDEETDPNPGESEGEGESLLGLSENNGDNDEDLNESSNAGETDVEQTPRVLTWNELNQMRREFVFQYRRNVDMMIKMVQLLFHICVGGCDGCIDLSAAGNKGLLPTYRKLRAMYERWEDVVSLADYAVIGAYEAVKMAIGNGNNRCHGRPCRVNIPFRSGRRTCSNPDEGKPQVLPDGDDIHAPQRVFMQNMGLSRREMVAIMGGHSLGGAHIGVSGYRGDWDLTRNTLDNRYYQALTQIDDWEHEYMPNAGAVQWSSYTQRRPIMMLHCDMALARSFTVSGDQKTPSCNANCPESDTMKLVKEFADDNKEFIDTFVIAYRKMADNSNFDPSLSRDF